MPTTPDISAEVVARSFGSETATGVPLTPDQKAAQTRGTELRKVFDKVKDNDPLSTLRPTEKPENSLSGFTDEVIRAQVDRRFGEPKPGEPDRRVDAIEEIRKLKILAKDGLTGLTFGEGNAFIGQYIDNVLSTRSEFAKLTRSELIAIAKTQLEDPTIRTALAVGIAEKFSPDADTETAEDKRLVEVQTQMEQEEANRIAKVKEYGEADKKLAELEKRKQDLRIPDPADPDDRGGDKYQEIEKIRDRLKASTGVVDLKATMSRDEANYSFQKSRVEQIIEANNKLGKNTTEADFPDEQSKNMFKIVQYDRDNAELSSLIHDKDTIDEQIETQEQTVKALEKEMEKMAADGVRSQTELIKLQTKIDAQKNELFDNLRTMVADTGKAQMEVDIVERMQKYQDQQTEQAKKSNDADIQKLGDARKDRWSYIDNSKRGHPRVRFKSAQQDSDWVNALTTGDVTSEIKSMLMSDLMPAPGDTPEELQRKSEEMDRIEKRFTDEPDWVKQQSELYVQDLLTSRLMAGKVPFGGEIAVLQRNGWDKLIEKSVAENDNLRNLIDSKLGAAGGHGRLEMLKHEYGDNWLSILGLLMAGMVVPGYVGRRLMNEEMGRAR